MKDLAYSVVSIDALDLIEEIEAIDGRSISLVQRLRMSCVFVHLAMNCQYGHTKWGAKSCSEWLNIAEATASQIIKDLQTITLKNGEPLVEKTQRKMGFYTLLKITQANGVMVPHNLKHPRHAGEPSVIKKMFANKQEKFLTRGRRLMMLIRVYQLFDEAQICIPAMKSTIVQADEEYSDSSSSIAFVPTQLFDVSPVGAWCFPHVTKKRDAVTQEAAIWLAEHGLISMVRLAINNGCTYVASFQSKYWRERIGDFQASIRQQIDATEGWKVNCEYECTLPIYFMGQHLCISIMPQYLVITNKVKSAIRSYEQNAEASLEELESE